MAGKLCQNYLYQIEWLTIEQLTWLLRVRVCVCVRNFPLASVTLAMLS